jgi:hypothetical protein
MLKGAQISLFRQASSDTNARLFEARNFSPALSTISVHGDAIGRTAATLTLDRDSIDLGFELVLRDSG